jgi:outer membrane protein TolC
MRTWCVAVVLLSAGPVSAQEVSAQPASTSALSALVTELDAHNPELEAARREIDERAARVAPAGALPDPTLGVGYMSGFLRPPFFPSAATPEGFRQVALTQTFPLPGTRALRTRAAESEVETARRSADATRARLVADLKQAYVEYVLATRALEIVQRNKEALDQLRQAAETRFSVGQASQPDVLRAQLEISILLERLAQLDRDRQSAAAEINRLAARPPDAAIDATEPIDVPAATLSLEMVRTRAAEQFPDVRRDDAVVAERTEALALTRREQRPELGVRLATQKGAGDMPWMYGLDLMVSLPLFWGRKQAPIIAGASAALDAARSARANTAAAAVARATQEHAALTASRTLVDLYGDSVLPQARLTLESSLAAYEVGRVDFLTVITSFVAVLNYEISLEEERARAWRALARLEPLTGLSLLR